MRNSTQLAWIACGLLTLPVLATSAHAATQITVVNKDGAGEGFNATTPFTPVGGNPATTIGQARLIAFQHAAFLWGRRLFSKVEIKIDAEMNALDCATNWAVLGSAGPNTADRDFPSGDPTYEAPVANTWHPQALANAIAGFDRTATQSEVSAAFNSNLGGSSCLPSQPWYFGLDGKGPSGSIDFVSVVLHELGHGLGFLSFLGSDGKKLLSRNDVYSNRLGLENGATVTGLAGMTDAERAAAMIGDPNLTWTGPAPRRGPRCSAK